MQIFEVEHNGETYEVEANSYEEAASAFGAKPQGNTEPLPYHPRNSPTLDSGMDRRSMGPAEALLGRSLGGPKVVDTRSPGSRQDANSGVDIYNDAGLNFTAKLAAGIASTPEDKKYWYGQQLAKKYGWKNPEQFMKVSPFSGEILYFNPDSKRWTPVEQAGPGAEDIAPITGAGLEAAGAIGGAFFGSGVGSVGTGAMGAFGGRALYETARGPLARKLGVDAPKDDPNYYIKEGAQRATNAFLVEGAGGLAVGTARVLKGMFRGFKVPITPTEAQQLLDAQVKYDSLFQKINSNPLVESARQARAKEIEGSVPSDFNFNPRADRLTTNTAIKGKAKAISDYPGTDAANQALTANNFDMLNVYLQGSEQPFKQGLVTGQGSYADAAGTLGKEAVTSEKQRIIGTAQERLAAAKEKNAYYTEDLPGRYTDEGASGASIRNEVTRLKDISQETVDGEYAKFKDMIGQKGYQSVHQVPVSKGMSRLIKDFNNLAEIGLIPEQMLPAAKLGLREGDQFDLAVVQDAIQRLRAVDRKAWTDQNSIGLLGGERSRVIDELVNMRDKYLSKNAPDAYKQLILAEKTFSEHASNFRNGFIGDMLRRDGEYGYTMKDPSVVWSIIKDKNGIASNQLASLAKGSPALQNELRKVAFADYRNAVIKNGEIDDALHKKYMEDNFTTIAPLFSKADQAILKKAGGYAAVVLKSEQQLAQANEVWKTALNGKLAKLDAYSPEAMVHVVFSGGNKAFTPAELSGLKAIINKHAPEGGLDMWRAGVAEDVRRRISKNGVIDYNSLDTLLKKREANIKAVMGEGYVNNLRTLKEATALMAEDELKSAGLAAMSGSPRFTRGMKAVVGPLSRESRVITFFSEERKQATAEKLYAALTDPEELKYWANHFRRKNAQYRTALGVTPLLRNEWESTNE